jgi:hypothetical protein
MSFGDILDALKFAFVAASGVEREHLHRDQPHMRKSDPC